MEGGVARNMPKGDRRNRPRTRRRPRPREAIQAPGSDWTHTLTEDLARWGFMPHKTIEDEDDDKYEDENEKESPRT